MNQSAPDEFPDISAIEKAVQAGDAGTVLRLIESYRSKCEQLEKNLDAALPKSGETPAKEAGGSPVAPRHGPHTGGIERGLTRDGYYSLFEKMTEGFAVHEIVCDDQGVPVDYRFLDLNPAFEKLTGLQQPDVVGRLVTEVLPGIESYWIETYGKVALTGTPVRFTNYSAPLDKYYDVYAYSPGTGLFAVLFSDVTERKRIEDDLRKSDRDLKRAQAVAHVGSWRLDYQKNELLWSNETYHIFGIPIGTPLTYEIFLESVHPDDREYVNRKWTADVRGEPYDIEHRIVVDGEIRWVCERAELEVDGDGNLLGGFGTVQDITERKLAEMAFEENRKENKFLADLVNRSSQAFAIGYPDGRLGLHNPAFERMTGYNTEELRQIDWANKLTPPEWLDMERGKLAELNRTGRPVRYEKEHIRKDGSRMPVELLVHLVRDDAGNPDHYYSFLTDITERKQAEEERQHLSRQRQIALDAARLGWWNYNPITGISTYDDRYKEIFEVTGHEKPNDEILTRLHPEDLPGVWEKVEAALDPDDPKPFAADYRINMPDGRVKWIEAHGIAAFEENGKGRRATSLVGTVEDITRRKFAEDALRETTDYLENLFNYANAPIICWDARFNITRFNHAFEVMTQYAADEVIGKNLSMLFPADSCDNSIELIERTLSGEQFDVVEIPIRRKDGEVRIALWNSANVYAKDGHLIATIAQGQDITDRKAAAEALRTNEERIRLAAAVPSIIFAELDTEMRYTWVQNPHYDFDASEVIGKRDDELDSSDEAWQLVKIKRDAMKSGNDQCVDWSVERPDGRHYYEIHIQPRSDDNGKIIGIRTAAIDITDRKRAEEALQEAYEQIQSQTEELQAQSEELQTQNEELQAQSEELQTQTEELQAQTLELHEANDAISEKEEDLRHAQEVGHIGSWRLDTRTNVLTWSPENHRIFGIPERTQMNYETFLGAVHPDDRAFADKTWKEALKGKPYDIEHRIVANGTVKWVREKADLEFDSEGQLRGGFGITQDITARKQAEEEIERLSRFPQENPHPVLRITADGRVIYANKASEPLLIEWGTAVRGMLPDCVCSVVKRVWMEGRSEKIEKVCGDLVYSITFAYVSGADYVNLYCLDITERKKAEQALRDSEEQYRMLVDNAQSIIIRWKQDGEITFANDFALDFFGYRRGEMIGNNASILLPDQDTAGGDLTSLADDIVRNPGKFEININENINKNGDRITVAWTNTPIADHDGKPEEILSIGNDITAMKDLERRIDSFHREQEAFMRHEIKNLITPIKIHAANLKMGGENLTGRQLEIIGKVEHNIERINAFVEKLKHVTGFEFGTTKLQLEPLSLDTVLDEAVTDIMPVAEQHLVHLRYNKGVTDVVMPLDKNFLPGVFANLILNAIQHVAPLNDQSERTVSIDFGLDNDRPVVSIRNGGKPIPPDRLTTFFEKFNTGPEKRGGTGLGTTYAYHVTRAHGGNIRVESSAETGTTVLVTFPEMNGNREERGE